VKKALWDSRGNLIKRYVEMFEAVVPIGSVVLVLGIAWWTSKIGVKDRWFQTLLALALGLNLIRLFLFLLKIVANHM